jgi:hypothetical protein
VEEEEDIQVGKEEVLTVVLKVKVVVVVVPIMELQ